MPQHFQTRRPGLLGPPTGRPQVDPEGLLMRSIAQPGQVATNVGGSVLAGLLGIPGDIGEFGQSIGRAVGGRPGGIPGIGMIGPASPRITSQGIQESLGVEPERIESMAGLLGAPDPADLARAGGRGLLAMTLFHGTPHKFSKFDLSKIGTGEGAQAFGHGLYFAENPGVARSYKQSTVPQEAVELQDQLNAITREKNEITLRRQSPSTIDDELTDNARFDELRKLEGDVAAELRTVKTRAGHLYEVEIPDEITDRMLDWDKPLSEQPESVRKAFGKLSRHPALQGNNAIAIRRNLERTANGEPATWGRYRVKNLYEDIAEFSNGGKGSNEINVASGMFTNQGGEAAASKALNEAGIPGIRYFDQQSRGTAEGTRNIVLFDPDQITQVKRDGELVFENKLGLKPDKVEDVARDGGLLGVRQDKASGGLLGQINPAADDLASMQSRASELMTEVSRMDDFLDEFEKGIPGIGRRIQTGQRPNIEDVRRSLESKSFTGDIPNIKIDGQKMSIRNPNDAVTLYEFALKRRNTADKEFGLVMNSILDAQERIKRLK